LRAVLRRASAANTPEQAVSRRAIRRAILGELHLNLALDSGDGRYPVQGARVVAQHREEGLAAGIGQQNAKGQGSKYSAGKTQKIHRVHDLFLFGVFLSDIS
jgi:hypothetical protein